MTSTTVRAKRDTTLANGGNSIAVNGSERELATQGVTQDRRQAVAVSALRRTVYSMIERRRTIAKAAELLGFPADEAAVLSRYAVVREVRAGDQLCALRSNARELTFLVSTEAEARLADGSVHPIPCGGVLGELSSLGVRLAQTADVFATKPGVVLVLRADRYQRLKGRLPGLSRRIEAALRDRSRYLAQASYERALQRHREMAPLARELGLQAL